MVLLPLNRVGETSLVKIYRSDDVDDDDDNDVDDVDDVDTAASDDADDSDDSAKDSLGFKAAHLRLEIKKEINNDLSN